jgi:hypothetical protein
MSISISHYQGRTDVSGAAVTLAAGDKVRAKLWREDATTPLLDLVSGTPTANGSSVTAANPTRLTVNQSDASWAPGIYSIEVAIVDAGDTLIRHADSGVFVLHKSPGGEVT